MPMMAYPSQAMMINSRVVTLCYLNLFLPGILILRELAHGDMVVRSETFQNQSSENTLHEIPTEISDSALIPGLHKPWLVGLRFCELKYNF